MKYRPVHHCFTNPVKPRPPTGPSTGTLPRKGGARAGGAPLGFWPTARCSTPTPLEADEPGVRRRAMRVGGDPLRRPPVRKDLTKRPSGGRASGPGPRGAGDNARWGVWLGRHIC
jgi:hypothetical protein